VIYMVESIDVAAPDTRRFLDAFERVFLPPARERGMKLLACWHTPETLGEDVTVTAIFEIPGWGEWDELRRRTVLDPAMPEWIELRNRLARRGQRRFYTPAEFSPLR
jgi:hypothetical protein